MYMLSPIQPLYTTEEPGLHLFDKHLGGTGRLC